MVDSCTEWASVTPTPDRVYEALTTPEGLRGWWTEDVAGSSEPGGVLEFRFPPVGGSDMGSLEARRARGRPAGDEMAPPSGSGRRSTGSCVRTASTRIVLFTARRLARPLELMHHCSTKWGRS